MTTLLNWPARAWLVLEESDDRAHPWLKRATVALRYDTTDPWFVAVAVSDEVYPFDRDELADAVDGIRTAAGAPDVGLAVTLESGTRLTVQVRPARLVQFLASSFRAVPAGAEVDAIDWTDELARLVEEAD